jgi:hypothetical protein
VIELSTTILVGQALELFERLRKAAGCLTLLSDEQVARLTRQADDRFARDWLRLLADMLGERYDILDEDDTRLEARRKVEILLIERRVRWFDPRGVQATFVCHDSEVGVVASPVDWGIVSPIAWDEHPAFALLVFMLTGKETGQELSQEVVTEAVAMWLAEWPEVSKEVVAQAVRRAGLGDVDLSEIWTAILVRPPHLDGVWWTKAATALRSRQPSSS